MTTPTNEYLKTDIETEHQTEHKVKLTSAEMANLWTSFQNDTMAICVLKYFLTNIEDKDIHGILEYALHLSERHVETIKVIFTEEKFPIPHGFSENDVDLTVPRLFSDTFYLYYMSNMAKFGANAYTVALANVSRSDIRKFYSECNQSSIELMNNAIEILKQKGILIRPPCIPTPTQVDYVQKQNFLTGWFGDRRSLTSLEIMNLFFNIERNAIGQSLLIGFSQVAKSKKVQEYMIRGKNIATKHIEIFTSLLREDEVPAPAPWDSATTTSTISPFSDKLLMFHTAALIAAGVGYYGASMGASNRRDLAAHYTRLSGEIMQYAEDGANIMIDNAWLEQPPSAVDRDDLVKGKM